MNIPSFIDYYESKKYYEIISMYESFDTDSFSINDLAIVASSYFELGKYYEAIEIAKNTHDKCSKNQNFSEIELLLMIIVSSYKQSGKIVFEYLYILKYMKIYHNEKILNRHIEIENYIAKKVILVMGCIMPVIIFINLWLDNSAYYIVFLFTAFILSIAYLINPSFFIGLIKILIRKSFNIF
jgi:hypothetical protein